MDRVPKYILEDMGLSSQREFRQLKRKQLKEIMKAYKEYSLACAWCPGYPHGLSELLWEMKKSHSVKNWGK